MYLQNGRLGRIPTQPHSHQHSQEQRISVQRDPHVSKQTLPQKQITPIASSQLRAFDFPLRTESTTPHTPPPSSHSSRNRASFCRRTTTKRPAASNPSSPRVPANFPARSGPTLPAGNSPGEFHAPDDAEAKKPREKWNRKELRIKTKRGNKRGNGSTTACVTSKRDTVPSNNKIYKIIVPIFGANRITEEIIEDHTAAMKEDQLLQNVPKDGFGLILAPLDESYGFVRNWPK